MCCSLRMRPMQTLCQLEYIKTLHQRSCKLVYSFLMNLICFLITAPLCEAVKICVVSALCHLPVVERGADQLNPLWRRSKCCQMRCYYKNDIHA